MWAPCVKLHGMVRSGSGRLQMRWESRSARCLPVMRAIEKSGRPGKVRVIATDLFPEIVSAIEARSVFASLYQRPFTQGRMAFELLNRSLITGAQPERVIRRNPRIVLRSNHSLFVSPARVR